MLGYVCMYSFLGAALQFDCARPIRLAKETY